MLVFKHTKFIKSPFKNEDELEQVVVNNFEHMFGPSSIYLPKKLIRTAEGVGTIPDGFAIDLQSRKWFLVEAELLHHNVWRHIAPQVSKQVIASLQPLTRRTIEDLAIEQYESDSVTKDKFQETGIKEINMRKTLSEILEKQPSIGIPIDAVSEDLTEWARTLRYDVKLWKISKYVELQNPENVIYEFPEEFKPDLDTSVSSEETESLSNKYREIFLSDLIDSQMLSPGEKLVMHYKPRDGKKSSYTATIEEDGSLSLLDQTFSSPSYAALAGIQKAGSDRQTVNGWTSWKTKDGRFLADLRDEFIRNQISLDDSRK